MSSTLSASTLEVYERWAPSYPPLPHNPLMSVEQAAMLERLPPIENRRVLDLACGSGRYTRLLLERGAAQVTALDFAPSMLRQVNATNRICADMNTLPFRAQAFACIVSGLAVGHAADLTAWMTEVARVLETGGVVLYSDFHPAAAAAGLTRSFRDEYARTWQVPHWRHEEADHRDAAVAAGLQVETLAALRVGIEFAEQFPSCQPFYRRWHGLPLLLIGRMRKQ